MPHHCVYVATSVVVGLPADTLSCCVINGFAAHRVSHLHIDLLALAAVAMGLAALCTLCRILANGCSKVVHFPIARS